MAKVLNVLNKWNNQHQQKKKIYLTHTEIQQQHKKALQIIYG